MNMRFIVAIYHPLNYDGSQEGEQMARDIDALNEEMVAAGVRVFVGGLESTSSARAIRVQADGSRIVTDGPYLETKEHVGGFWILEVPDSEAAVEWGRKASIACRVPVDVRPFGRSKVD